MAVSFTPEKAIFAPVNQSPKKNNDMSNLFKAFQFSGHVKSEFAAAITPEEKTAICEAAEGFASEFIPQPWLEVVLLVITGLEATIHTTAQVQA